MSKDSCIWIPKVQGEPSSLYHGLWSMTGKNRPLANLLYASYITSPDIANAMNSAGYKVDNLGQHSASAVMKFLKVNDIIRAQDESIDTVATSAGFRNSDGTMKKYTSGYQAFKDAEAFNNKSKSHVANVYRNGDEFSVVVKPRDSRSVTDADTVKEYLRIWDDMSAYMAGKGLSLSNLSNIAPEVFNPINLSSAMSYLSRLQSTSPQNMSVRDIEIALELGSHIPAVAGFIPRLGGDLHAAAEQAYNLIHNPQPQYQTFTGNIITALERCVLKATYDASDLFKEHDRLFNINFQSGESWDIQQTIRQLHHDYNLEGEVILKPAKEIRYLSEIADRAIVNLRRQIEDLERKFGKSSAYNTQQTKEKLTNISKQLAKKQYYAGLLNFLNEASDYLQTAFSSLNGIQHNGDTFEYCKQKADALAQIKNMHSAYYDVVSKLSNLDAVMIDEHLNAVDRETLGETATKLKQMFDSQADMLDSLAKDTLVEIYSDVFKGETFMGESIANFISMAQADCTMWDKLYSLSRTSNPMIGGMYAVFDNARENALADLTMYARKIKGLTNALEKSGVHNTRFMYEKTSSGMRIASPYDWDAYYKARNKKLKELRSNGFVGVFLDSAMEQWIEDNTDEKVVDAVTDPNNVRTERVPKLNLYGKQANFQEGWTQAMKDYYDGMMDIKGRLGTLMPEYARDQYLPPQRRKAWRDLVNDAVTRRLPAGKVAKMLLDRMKFWKLRQDDTSTGSTGQLDRLDTDAAFMRSSYDDSPIREIPLFFVNKLENQDELLQDFSGAMQSLANAATTNHELEKAKGLIDEMADWIINIGGSPQSRNGKPTASRFKGLKNIIAPIRDKAAHYNTTEIVDGFMEMLVYGNTRSTDDAWQVAVDRLNAFNSYKGLALNEKGAIANLLAGVVQNIVEAGAGQHYGFKDLAVATVRILGADGVTGEFWDMLTDDRNSNVHLFKEMFDPNQDVKGSLADKRYFRSLIRRISEDNSLTFGYEIGEDILHLLVMYGVLNHEKVFINGEVKPLYDAFQKVYDSNNVAHLQLKDNVYRLDGSKVDNDYIQSVKDNIKTANQRNHGSMNREDRGVATRTWLARLALNFRQWMIESYSKRYRSAHFEANAGNVLDTNFFFNHYVLVDGKKTKLFDAFDRTFHSDGSMSVTLKNDVKHLDGTAMDISDIEAFRNFLDRDNHLPSGFYSDTFKLIKSLITEAEYANLDMLVKWGMTTKRGKPITDMQKQNFRRVNMELSMIALLALGVWCMGDPDKHRGERNYKMLLYQLKRQLADEVAFTVVGAPSQGNSFITQPIPAAQTLKGLYYPIDGAIHGDFNKKLTTGPNAGENKYIRNIKKYSLPLWSQIDKSKNFADDPNVFKVFESDFSFR